MLTHTCRPTKKRTRGLHVSEGASAKRLLGREQQRHRRTILWDE